MGVIIKNGRFYPPTVGGNKAFYLYQPSIPFSFKLSGLTSEECPVYVHCIYANVKTLNSLSQSNLFKTKLDYEV